MTIKEQLAEKKAALVELEPQLKSDPTDEMIEQGETLVKEIADLEAKCAQADRAEALLKTIGTADETNTDNSEEKTMSQMEEFTKKAAEMVDRKAGASMHFEKAYNSVVTAPTIADVDKSIAPQPKRIAAEDFLSVATISGNAVTYFTQGAFETYNNAGISTTSQNSKKPQVSTSFAGTTLALSKIAAWLKETDEILVDAPFLASECEGTLVYQLGKASDNFIINTIGSTVGIGAETYDGTTKTFADGILASILKVKEKYDASVVYLNPADVYTLLSAKDSNKQYYGGGYFSGAYGNGALGIPSSIWGVPMFASSQVTQGSALVVAKEAVKVWKKGGIDVKLFEQNEDDALYNRVTLLGEVREACAVVDLAGVVLLASGNS